MLSNECLNIMNHALAGPYCGDSPEMQFLICEGFMKSAGKKSFVPDEYFTITEHGRKELALSVSDINYRKKQSKLRLNDTDGWIVNNGRLTKTVMNSEHVEKIKVSEETILNSEYVLSGDVSIFPLLINLLKRSMRFAGRLCQDHRGYEDHDTILKLESARSFITEAEKILTEVYEKETSTR